MFKLGQHYLNEFKNKIVLVTGGSSGIGLSISKSFHTNGAIVYNLDISQPLENLKSIFLKTDVSNFDNVNLSLEKIIAKSHKIDIVISNAAIRYDGNILDVASDDFKKMLIVNSLGSWNVAKSSIPYLLKTSGTFIQVASGESQELPANLDGYYSSKAACFALVNALRSSFSNRNIHIRGISSACHVATPMLDTSIRKNSQMFDGEKIYSPEEISNIVLRIASSKNKICDERIVTI